MVRIVSCVDYISRILDQRILLRNRERMVNILELRFRNCKPITNTKEFQVQFHPAHAATINGLVLCQDMTVHDKSESEINHHSDVFSTHAANVGP